MNRRVRTRMHGGVGGRSCETFPYPDYMDRKTEFSYSFDPASFGFTSADYEIRQITSKGTKLLNKSKGEIVRTEMLDPEEIKIIEIKPTEQ